MKDKDFTTKIKKTLDISSKTYPEKRIFAVVDIQAVRQKATQEDDIKIINKHDLAAIIQFKTHLYILNRWTISFPTRLCATDVLSCSV